MLESENLEVRGYKGSNLAIVAYYTIHGESNAGLQTKIGVLSYLQALRTTCWLSIFKVYIFVLLFFFPFKNTMVSQTWFPDENNVFSLCLIKLLPFLSSNWLC